MSAPPSPSVADRPLRLRVQQAMHRSQRVFPPPVGQVVFREIEGWLDHGWRFGGYSEMTRLADTVLRLPNWVEPTTGDT
jgi:hypothetical protein